MWNHVNFFPSVDLFSCAKPTQGNIFVGKKITKKVMFLRSVTIFVLLLKQAFQLVSHFSHTIFFNWQKKVIWNLWYRVNLLEKSAFWSCIYFFHPDQKKEKKNPSWFHTSRKKFQLRKKYLKNPFCVLNQVTRLQKKKKKEKLRDFWGKMWVKFF